MGRWEVEQHHAGERRIRLERTVIRPVLALVFGTVVTLAVLFVLVAR
jgi:hypothetical protein